MVLLIEIGIGTGTGIGTEKETGKETEKETETGREIEATLLEPTTNVIGDVVTVAAMADDNARQMTRADGSVVQDGGQQDKFLAPSSPSVSSHLEYFCLIRPWAVSIAVFLFSSFVPHAS